MKLVTPLLCLTVVFVYFGYLMLFLRDAPVGVDDVLAINQFLNQYILSKSWVEAWGLIFQPFREHILMTAKLSALLYWELFKNFNFVGYALIGNLCFVGITLLLIRNSWKGEMARLIYFVPVLLLFFHAQYMQTALWPMAVWSNGWVIFWVLLSLYFLNASCQRVGWSSKAFLGAASLVACLATFSNGNGILVFGAGIYILWAYRSSWGRFLLWSLLFGFCLACYISLRKSEGLGTQIFEPGLLLNPLAFLGAYVALVKLPIIREIGSVAAGVFIVASSCYFFVSKLATEGRKKDAWLIASLLFVMLTAVAVGVLRAEENKLEGMHIGRYRHYSSLAFCIVYLLFLRNDRAKNTVLYVSLLPAFVGWLLSFYVEYGYSKTFSNQTVASYYNGMVSGLFLPQHDYENKLAVEIIRRSASENIHHPDLFGDWVTPEFPRKKTDTIKVPLKISRYEVLATKGDGKCFRRVQLEFSGVHRPTSVNRQSFATLRMGSKKYLLATSAHKASLSELLLHGNYFDQNIQAELIPCGYPKGTYAVELWKGIAEGQYIGYSAGRIAL